MDEGQSTKSGLFIKFCQGGYRNSKWPIYNDRSKKINFFGTKGGFDKLVLKICSYI